MVLNNSPCIHCRKPQSEHWAPYAFCSIDDSVTPETATRYCPDDNPAPSFGDDSDK